MLLTVGVILEFVFQDKERERKIIAYFLIGLLIVISGTRDHMGGYDYYNYEASYNRFLDFPNLIGELIRNPNYLANENYNVGYIVLNSFAKMLNLSFYGFTLLHAIIFYTLMTKGLFKYCRNYSFLLIVFLYKIFYYNTFISMRQSLTIAIFFFSLQYLFEKKLWKYMLCCVISVSLHTGAYLMFPLYLLHYINLNQRKVLFILLMSIPLFLVGSLNLPLLDWLIGFMDDSKYITWIQKADSLNILHTFEYFIVMIIVFIYYDKIISENKYGEFFIKLLLVLLPMYTIFRNYDFFTREKDYFTIFYGIVLGYICFRNNMITLKRLTITIATICFCILGYTKFIFSFNNAEFTNYRSYLFNDDAHVFVIE